MPNHSFYVKDDYLFSKDLDQPEKSDQIVKFTEAGFSKDGYYIIYALANQIPVKIIMNNNDDSIPVEYQSKVYNFDNVYSSFEYDYKDSTFTAELPPAELFAAAEKRLILLAPKNFYLAMFQRIKYEYAIGLFKGFISSKELSNDNYILKTAEKKISKNIMNEFKFEGTIDIYSLARELVSTTSLNDGQITSLLLALNNAFWENEISSEAQAEIKAQILENERTSPNLINISNPAALEDTLRNLYITRKQMDILAHIKE